MEKVAIIKAHHHAAAAQDAVVCDQLLSDTPQIKETGCASWLPVSMAAPRGLAS